MCPCPLLLDLRRLALSLRLLVVWFRINPILLALFQNPMKRDPMSSLQGRNPGRNVAKSSDIDFFLKADKTSLKELTNSELCETEEELD
jgi:hypothetical protein